MNNYEEPEPEMSIEHQGYFSGIISAGVIMLLIDALIVYLYLAPK